MNVKKIKIIWYRNYNSLKNNDYNVESFDKWTTLSLDKEAIIMLQTYDIHAQGINDAIIDQNNTIIQLLCHIADNLNNK